MWKRLLAGVAGAAYGAVLVAAEVRRPLRHAKRESKWVRDVRNLAIAGLGGATVQLLEDPVVRPLAVRVRQKRWGLLQQRPLPAALELLAGVLLMDYTLYLWHVLTHRVPFLWRFHAAHHADLDIDASTAIRFHFGELALSVPYSPNAQRVAGFHVRFHPLPPLRHRPAPKVGTAFADDLGDATAAWYSSFREAR